MAWKEGQKEDATQKKDQVEVEAGEEDRNGCGFVDENSAKKAVEIARDGWFFNRLCFCDEDTV